jgi:hypothetical protein
VPASIIIGVYCISAVRKVVSAIERTEHGALLHDDERRRHELFKMMADSGDPLLSEMGSQLRNGLHRPRDLMASTDYAEILARALDNLADFDLDRAVLETTDIAEATTRDREAGHR